MKRIRSIAIAIIPKTSNTQNSKNRKSKVEAAASEAV